MKAEIDAKQLSFYFCQMPGQSVGGAPNERERERERADGDPLDYLERGESQWHRQIKQR